MCNENREWVLSNNYNVGRAGIITTDITTVVHVAYAHRVNAVTVDYSPITVRLQIN